MFKNYLKVAIRYLSKHKGYAVINVFGLAIGIACCILIMLFVKSEWSYDRFHSKADRLYRARIIEQYEGQSFSNVSTPLPLGGALQTNIPEVESMSRVFNMTRIIKTVGRSFSENIHMVDSGFFNMFDFRIIEGNTFNPLSNSTSIVLSKDMAKKHFGDASAIGETLEMKLGDADLLFTVTAVTENSPLESSIRYDFLIPFSNDHYIFSEKQRTSGWSNVYGETYVLLRQGTKAEAAAVKFPAMMKKIAGNKYKPDQYTIYLQPITDIHLNNEIPEGIEPVSDPKYSYILGTIGILVLLIACINFITLSIGRSVSRAAEVGVRKVLGAGRAQLVYQYWGEALIITTAATITGILLSTLMLPAFNEVVNRELQFSADIFTILYCISILLIVAFISGIYPAFILSGYAPVQVLKGKLQTATGMGMLRKGLIVCQFVASIVMIIGTMVIGKQLGYLQNKDLGYEKEQVVIIPTNKPSPEGYKLASRLIQQLNSNPEVITSTSSLYSFAEPGWVNLGYKDDKGIFRQFRTNVIDYDFIKTMNLQLIAGRNFLKENRSDISQAMIINEALAREYGWTNPIGKKLPGKYDHQVIGVVKDFHYESLHNPVQPLAMVLLLDSLLTRSSDMMFSAAAHPRVSIRLKTDDLQTQIGSLRKNWHAVAGDQDFQFRFLDETLNAAYQQEQRLGSLVRYASILSIIIACMGLFGLATLIIVRRTKEIGIRKVLGANVGSIVILVSRDFIIMIILASLIAFPLAWLGLQKWLQDFTYRIEIPVPLFFGAAALTLIITLITVGLQAVKAALLNPVKSLRTE